MKNISVAFVLSGIVLVGCSGKPSIVQPVPRPVSYVTLQTMNPSKSSRLTGSVESWKREDIGFEVAGRILRVVEPGANIVGRTFDEDGNLRTEGTVIAELDSERYEIAEKQAQAAAEAARTDLEEVLPQMLAEATAALDLANIELARKSELKRQNAVSQRELDTAVAAQEVATAKVAQVESLRATKASMLKSALATVEQAKVNIVDCKLYSPFTGQIARVHLIAGGFVLPGQAVVTVQMMDPMKVNIAVSAATDERINQNDLVRVFAPNGEEFEGRVYMKDTFADPSTRTFLVTLLMRNQLVMVGIPDELKDEDVPQCRHIWCLEQVQVGSEDNYYVEVNAIQQDDEGFFVWKIENLTREQLYEDFDPVLTVKKVRVTPGDGLEHAQQVFTFRELTDIGELDPAVDVIAADISGEAQDGGQMVLVRERWLSRPGDVVRVGLKGEMSPPGFYVPQEAIQFDGQRHFVFIAEPAGDSHQVVNIEVTPAETVGRLQRIDTGKDGQLSEGMKIIVDGAHYVVPKDKVNPVKEVEVQP